MGRLDLHDERLVGFELERAHHGTVLRRRAHRGAVERRVERVRILRSRELQEEVEIRLDEVAQRDQLARHRGLRVDRFAAAAGGGPDSRSIDNDDATSVSQS